MINEPARFLNKSCRAPARTSVNHQVMDSIHELIVVLAEIEKLRVQAEVLQKELRQSA